MATTRVRVVPVTWKRARAWTCAHHRHHRAPVGYRLLVGIEDGAGQLRGVGIGGRPVARGLDDGLTLEVTRCCTDGVENGCSMLYGALRRAARALGYRRVVTYTRADEPGASLRAAGFRRVAETAARSWDAPSRPRVDQSEPFPRVRWEWP